MAQFDFPLLDPEVTTGTDLAGDLNSWAAALESLHSGLVRPTYAGEGLLWLDKSGGASNWSLKLYDGADDIQLFSIDSTLNKIMIGSVAATITGGTINNAVIGGTTPAAGTFTTLRATGQGNIDGGLVVGVGGASDDTRISIMGGSNAGKGASLTFSRAGAPKLYVGTADVIVTDGSDDAVLYALGDIKFYRGGAATGAYAFKTNAQGITGPSGNPFIISSATGQPGYICINTVPVYAWDNAKFFPAADNTLDLGGPGLRWGKVCTGIIDSMTGAPILFRINNGAVQATIAQNGDGTNYITLMGANTTQNVGIYAQGSDSNVSINYVTKGAGLHSFLVGNSVNFQVRGAAGSTNFIWVGGSAGGTPTLQSTGGGINITAPFVFFTGIGTTVSAANAFIDPSSSFSLLRSTSSLRYKKNVQPLELDDARNIVLRAEPITFEGLHNERACIGLSAEGMAEIDERMIVRDAEGLPDWVQYPHLVAPIMLVLQQQERRIAELERARQ
jgi:hypothetical protein